ncbi:MAG: hypothetical protein IPP90_12485 [Gemmatimonadaceae bacterium]|nr:hypothetical protein [Gemmatimonadaceae bacterium]
MQRSRIALVAGLSLAWLAACDAPARQIAPVVSDAPNAPNFDRSNSGENGGDDAEDESGHRHEHGLIGAAAARAAQKARVSGTGISYHGGRVLQSGINIVAVYWGSSAIYAGGPTPGTTGAGTADGSVVGYFLRNVGGSPYYNINTTYTNGSIKLLNVVNYTRFWANNANVPSNGQNVSDAAITAMLQSGFTSGALTYDANTLYSVFTAGTVNLGGGFGTQYCAYHTNANVTVPGLGTKQILYAAMPYNYAYPSGCSAFGSTASPNGDKPADSEVNTLIHEIEETQTDALGNAWYDNRGYENADKCAWQWGTTYTNAQGGKANIKLGTKDFLVQMNWINSGSGGCRISW